MQQLCRRLCRYMSNASINTCTDRSSGPPHSPGRAWDARHFADMVSPFLDMTVKGWTWCKYLQQCVARSLPSCVASAFA